MASSQPSTLDTTLTMPTVIRSFTEIIIIAVCALHDCKKREKTFYSDNKFPTHFIPFFEFNIQLES